MDDTEVGSRSELLTVIVPNYNERETLRESVKRLLDTSLPVRAEVLVVDDGSTDSSIETIADLVEDGSVRVVALPKNRGKGAAIRAGLQAARGTVATILDADLE